MAIASEAKIKFTHDGSNYKFINPTPSSSNDVVIRNLHNIAADAKNINKIEDYYVKKTGDYDFCHLTAFKFFNPEVLQLGDIPDSQ